MHIRHWSQARSSLGHQDAAQPDPAKPASACMESWTGLPREATIDVTPSRTEACLPAWLLRVGELQLALFPECLFPFGERVASPRPRLLLFDEKKREGHPQHKGSAPFRFTKTREDFGTSAMTGRFDGPAVRPWQLVRYCELHSLPLPCYACLRIRYRAIRVAIGDPAPRTRIQIACHVGDGLGSLSPFPGPLPPEQEQGDFYNPDESSRARGNTHPDSRPPSK
ncbi:hypothetical protein CSOJ01_07317 [Colletotrichum sojae]|uniref:Uncharacterized protein n=1 Tax=Colletotrichum sojae TaxID=2175907 RepID=A0A8H6J9Z8_9PEZI|nr:hypothetical protein CSOJ01_07317 [Colletotrichum sojae]